MHRSLKVIDEASREKVLGISITYSLRLVRLVVRTYFKIRIEITKKKDWKQVFYPRGLVELFNYYANRSPAQ